MGNLIYKGNNFSQEQLIAKKLTIEYISLYSKQFPLQQMAEGYRQ